MRSVLTLQKSIITQLFLFSSAPKSLTEENLRQSYSEMSSISAPMPQFEVSPAAKASPPVPEKVQTAHELSGYRPSMRKEEDAHQYPSPISDNFRTRIWTSQDLSLYSNSEYVYAIFPIEVALFWGKGVCGFHVETIVYDFYNSNTLSEHNCYK